MSTRLFQNAILVQKVTIWTWSALTGTRILPLDHKDLNRYLDKALVDNEAMEDPKDDNGKNDKQYNIKGTA